MSKATNQLPTVSAADACTAAFLAIDGMQRLPAGEQVAGIAFLLFVMKQQLGLDISNLMNQSERRFNDVDTFYKREAAALADYAKGELL